MKHEIQLSRLRALSVTIRVRYTPRQAELLRAEAQKLGVSLCKLVRDRTCEDYDSELNQTPTTRANKHGLEKLD